ncbi:MAG: hypothetical protein KGD67_00305 [Candidatus Lokiarchaeota archaeon]|nr:hypothetical protein [Candidatus Lokiarchaeota archaeon]
MKNHKKNDLEIKSKLESEIYAVIKTILNLAQKYQNGSLKDNFFQKSIKSATNDLLTINISLGKYNLALSEILKSMNYGDDYYRAIDIINKISPLDFPVEIYSKSVSSSFLEIPKISSEITSSFITLMDALKLNDFHDEDLIFGLFNDLKNQFDKFPGLELSKVKLQKIFQEYKHNHRKLGTNKNYRDLIAEEIYALYNEFKRKLNLEL